MMGIIISLAIISGVLFYVDSTNDTLVQNALGNVMIDAAVSQPTLNVTEMNDLAAFIDSNISSTIIDVEPIANINPFFFRTGGAIATSQSDAIPATLTTITDLNFSTTYIFGVNPEYFDTFSLFDTSLTTTELATIFSNEQVLVSNELFASLGTAFIGGAINVSVLNTEVIQSGGGGQRTLNTELVSSSNVTIGGTISVNMDVLLASIDAFYPDLDDTTSQLTTQFANTPNVIVMNYSQLATYVAATPTILSQNSVHIKVDHTALSTDLDVLNSQISEISSKIEIFYPDLTVLNFLELTLAQVENQLVQMKLFLIYFALPGLLLGAFVFKYAIDLSIEERSREIGLLRTKGATRKQIAQVVGMESTILALSGMVVGIIVGYALSMLISISLGANSDLFKPITSSSLYYSLGIGVIIAATAAVLSTKQLLTPKVVDSVKAKQSSNVVFWKRLYVDFILLALVGIIYLLNYFGFDLIPDVINTTYDFLAPIFTWIGVSLALIRFFSTFLQKTSSTLTTVYHLLFGDLEKIISRNIRFRPKKLSTIAILLTLAISFGLTLAIISDTYQQAAVTDANYTIGGDIRIQFPGTDYLDYNTSDFAIALLSEFSQEINAYTSLYISQIRFGRTTVSILGIEVSSFLAVNSLDDYYFASKSVDAAMQSLLTPTDGVFSNVIFSSALADPTSTTTTTSPKGSGGGGSVPTTSTFTIGDVVPFTSSGEEIAVTIGDIANYFPAVSDITGRPEGDFPFAIANVDFLLNPSSTNTTLLTDANASIALISVKDGVDIQALTEQINEWYSVTYASSSALLIANVADEIADYQLTINSLLGLTSMEYILVLVISFLGMQIFLASAIYERKKEFGTYFALGASERSIRKIIFGEISAVVLFSVVAGTLLSFLISVMYLGFLSDLLILELFSISLPLINMSILLALELIGVSSAILISSSKLAKLDPANILRAM